jgi:hypothetical protein
MSPRLFLRKHFPTRVLMKTTRSFFLAIFLISLAAGLFAAAKPGEIDRLSIDLTPVGAERAGNASGTIPEWTGGITRPPENYQPGDHHQDPYTGETPLLRIDRVNMRESTGLISAGHSAMLQRYDDYFIEIYPTHRSAALPQHVYEKTFENGRTGRLTEHGEAVEDVAEGLPFPFPENAHELIWNHRLRFKGTGSKRHISLAAPTAKGSFVEVTMTVDILGLYYQQGATLESIDNRLLYFRQQTNSPARLAGSVLLVHESLNQVAQPRSAWVYNPGQRRVLRAPNVAYDNPSSATDGLHVSDMTDMFNGALDRFDWQLLDKREMYVPYNSYRVHSDELDYDDLVQAGHLDPQYLRYELHRVWVVEARLKKGLRHINPRRTYYLDEDSYQILMADHYDANGELWRFSEAHPIVFYEVPVLWTTIEVHHDLQSGRFVSYRLNPREPVSPFNTKMDPSQFTPQALRRVGRK